MDVQTDPGTSSALLKLLNEARSEADDLRKRLERQQKTLLSTRLIMGHELKRPTTAIRGFLDLALEQASPNGNGKCADSISKAIGECGLLDELNSFFVELLKVDGGASSASAEIVSVDDCLIEILDHFPESLDSRARVSLHISPGARRFRSNRNALRIILSNVLENALMYSDPGSPVEVRVDRVVDNSGMTEGDLLKIHVIDEGKGIPAGLVKTIFKPFVRLSQGASNGVGLGLTLVRSLVELHGGSVHVHSEMGRGTTIRITIPEASEDNQHDLIS
jgi:signal transduction histidine kinase